MDWFFILLVLIPLNFIMVSIVIWTMQNGISPMPTMGKVKRKLFDILPPPEKVSGKVYDLGSGWGTLVMPLGLYYPDHQVLGYETSPIPYWISKRRLFLTKIPNVRLLKEDFFSTNINQAGLVICYLYPGAMLRLKSKFENELQPGSWVISHTFSVPGWEPVATYEVSDLYHTKIYIYRTNQNIDK